MSNEDKPPSATAEATQPGRVASKGNNATKTGDLREAEALKLVSDGAENDAVPTLRQMIETRQDPETERRAKKNGTGRLPTPQMGKFEGGAFDRSSREPIL